MITTEWFITFTTWKQVKQYDLADFLFLTITIRGRFLKKKLFLSFFTGILIEMANHLQKVGQL